MLSHSSGLGNGGLGRLAACYLDSISRLGYPGFGHCLKYEYGLFKQLFIDGKQIEAPDGWLETGHVWLNPREDQAVEVLFGGTIKQNYDNNRLSYVIESPKIVKAMPYDMLISGYDSNTVSTLRLWEAKGITNSFNLSKFIPLNFYYSSILLCIARTYSWLVPFPFHMIHALRMLSVGFFRLIIIRNISMLLFLSQRSLRV